MEIRSAVFIVAVSGCGLGCVAGPAPIEDSRVVYDPGYDVVACSRRSQMTKSRQWDCDLGKMRSDV